MISTPALTPIPTVIDLVGSSSSSDWLTTVLPLITLVLGAALTYVFSWLSDSRRAAREDQQRWHELVRTLSAGILADAERMRALAIENYELGREMDDSIPIKRNVSVALLKEREAIVQKASELSIIVPLTFTEAMYAYVADAVTRADYESEGRDQAASNIGTSRIEFMKEIRKYLGLPSARLF